MADLADLRALCTELDGAPYPAYKRLKGAWDLGAARLDVVWVQGDPYAAPSVVHVTLDARTVDLPPELLRSRPRREGIEALFARAFARAADPASAGGSGRSGEVVVQDPGQLVVPQSAVEIDARGRLTARFRIGLPARGRRIRGGAAAELLTGHLPERIDTSLRAAAHAPEALRCAAETAEDAVALRDALPGAGLVAFVADGSILPRRSGADDRPLPTDRAVAFESPPSLRVTLDTPNAGPVRGLGVPEGVTLVAGGGFHGKSTLLRALQRGVYGHAPGDGRERVVTLVDAQKIRAEDGRAVTGVDISAFIDGLPGRPDTRRFTTADASGSTSQAASLVEALESGARLVLMDEDTTATNFMIRDRRMQALVPPEHEPITPFIDRVRALHADRGVSTVLVVGGSGDYLDVADTVIVMRDYEPLDAGAAARAVAREHPTNRRAAPPVERGRLDPPARTPDPASFDPRSGGRARSPRVRDGRLRTGRDTVSLSAIEQLVHPGQARAVGAALAWMHARATEALPNHPMTVPDLLDALDTVLASTGPAALDPFDAGESVAVRRHDVAAVLNRLRSLTLLGP